MLLRHLNRQLFLLLRRYLSSPPHLLQHRHPLLLHLLQHHNNLPHRQHLSKSQRLHLHLHRRPHHSNLLHLLRLQHLRSLL